MANRPLRCPAAGIVSGYMLRLCRESAELTQTGMAEVLGVDLATVQGWESGRRPLGACPGNG
jgi:DNA-binding transcriptional regulator YiaG